MATGSVTIEIDQATAAILQAKAVQQGVSLETLLQHLAGNITAATEEGLSPSSLEQFMADMGVPFGRRGAYSCNSDHLHP